MGNYKIKVQVEIVECSDTELSSPNKIEAGSFEMKINEAQAISIDDCEQALLQTNYAAVRDALAQHLSEVSKKSLRARAARSRSDQRASLPGGWRDWAIYLCDTSNNHRNGSSDQYRAGSVS